MNETGEVVDQDGVLLDVAGAGDKPVFNGKTVPEGKIGYGVLGGGSQHITTHGNHLSVMHAYNLPKGAVVITRRNKRTGLANAAIVVEDSEGLHLRSFVRLVDGEWKSAKLRKRIRRLGANPPIILHDMEGMESILNPALCVILRDEFQQAEEKARKARERGERGEKSSELRALGEELARLPTESLVALRELASLPVESLGAIREIVKQHREAPVDTVDDPGSSDW